MTRVVVDGGELPMMTAARILFLVAGGLWTLVGMLTPPLMDRGVGQPMLFVSERADTQLFSASPDEILDTNPDLVTLRGVLIRTLAGLLVAAGLLTVGVAWFGLSEPRTWALSLLTVVGLVVIPYWWVALTPYREAGIRLTLGDVPPLMWVPAVAMPIASVLGWVGHLRS